MAEQTKPWEIEWLSGAAAEVEAGFADLRREGIAMMGDLPAVDPATIHVDSEVVVRAPSLAPEREPDRVTLPWQIDWDVQSAAIAVESTPVSPAQEAPAEPEREIGPETDQIASDESTTTNGRGEFISFPDPVKGTLGGIGHLLIGDELTLYPEGTVIPPEVVDQWFIEDMAEAEEDTDVLLKGQNVPEEVRSVLTNMAFTLGRTKLKKFKKMFAAIKAENWEEAADEMVDSKWFGQVGTRSKRLVERMLSV